MPKEIEVARVRDDLFQAKIPLHRAQIAFRQSKALYRGFVAGRGAGKSYVGAYDLIRRAKAGRHYLIGSPTGVMMADTTFPTFKALAEKLHVWNPSKVRLSPYPTVQLTTGAEIRFRTAENPDRMRGPNLTGIWLDEGSQMVEQAFDISIASLREAGEDGWLSCTFTPKGTSHWTYTRFATNLEDTELVHCPTKANPFLSATFAERLSKMYVGAWAQQELGGLFVSMEGAEFDPAWFEDWPDRPFWFDDWPQPSDVLLRVIALDPSKGKDARIGQDGKGGDYSAFVILYLCKDGTMYVDADMSNRRNTVQIVSDGIRLYQQHSKGGAVDAFAIEINQYQELLAKDFLRECAAMREPVKLPVFGWNNQVNKEVRIRRLAPILAGVDGRIRVRNSPGGRLLVAQLRDFRAPPHPQEYHDDGPDGLELAVRMLLHLLNGGPSGEVGGPRAMAA